MKKIISDILSWINSKRFLSIFNRKNNRDFINAQNNCLIQPKIISRLNHPISRSLISENALKVLYRLKKHGFQAYLVGGCVRDILLEIEPKDFDIVTDARPEQVKKFFSNCRIIGRRFPLAHICFKDEIIEVATFRSGLAEKNVAKDNYEKYSGKNINSANVGFHSEEGMILRDNIYGKSIADDVFRRDFTANAIYYNIKDFSLIDYVDGLKDIKNKKLKLIGDPVTRYREDPVRMLRAVRFAAKLGFNIEEKTKQPIFELGRLLANVPPARIFEEYIKMFLKGHSHAVFLLLRETGLFKYLFPETEISLKQDDAKTFHKFIELSLKNTDERIANHKTISPAFLFAVFLWSPVDTKAKKLISSSASKYNAYFEAMDLILDIQKGYIALPRRIATLAKEIWSLQLHLERRHGKRASKVFSSSRFRAGYDFLLLRAASGETDAIELANWWTDYINSDEKGRWAMARALQRKKKRKKNR